MKKSRTDYATLNTSIALAIQPFQALIGFVSRTIFLNILGVTYLGLNNYLSSLVSMLSLAELGIGGAMTYALYGPLARKEHAKINAFMILFKKLYRMIGIGIFIIGSILALFLPYIIKDYPVNREVYIIYFLFVFNSASSYFFSYKRTLLYVDQRNYVMTSIDFSLYVLRILLQIGVLIYTKNFIIYLLVGILMNIVGNFIMSSIVDKMYDYLFNEEVTSITQEEKARFVKNIKGNIVGSIGETIVFQTDSLLMGAYISLTAIGLYGNYIFVLGFLSLLASTTINPVTSSIGNLIHSEDTTLITKLDFIKKFQFIDYFNKDNEVKNIYDFYLLTNYYSSILELLNDYKENKLILSDTNSEKKGVELVTIHKSKGLEFKTTFVIKNSKKSKTDDIDFLFEMNDKYDETVFSLFCKKGYKSILETCFEERIENYDKKIKEEEINNFYVALTRPKNNLIVIYEDRLFEENPLNESNIDDFFNCELGKISLDEKKSKTEDIIEKNLENDLYNSQSYFSSSIYEDEEEINRGIRQTVKTYQFLLFEQGRPAI